MLKVVCDRGRVDVFWQDTSIFFKRMKHKRERVECDLTLFVVMIYSLYRKEKI